MTTIKLTTKIKASKQIVFDLSRNIDLHQLSMTDSKEKAIYGITSGLVNLNDTVTFKGKHFGVYLTHQSRITKMKLYDSSTDEMIKGCFKSFIHHHEFEEDQGFTTMTDKIFYEVPIGIVGKIFDYLILKRYMQNLIEKRNNILKQQLEKQSGLIKPL